MNDFKYVFGPIPSRRLGRSLGISPLPKKTCNYSCIYCQLGRTDKMTNKRQEFYKTEDDRVYLLGALLHLKAYLELGMEYEKNRKIFSLILDNYGICYQDIFQGAEKME